MNASTLKRATVESALRRAPKTAWARTVLVAGLILLAATLANAAEDSNAPAQPTLVRIDIAPLTISRP